MRRSDFISETRQDTEILLGAIDRLRNKQREWNALDYANTLHAEELEGYEGLTTANIGSVIFDTVDAFDAVLAQGHATNLHRLR